MSIPGVQRRTGRRRRSRNALERREVRSVGETLDRRHLAPLRLEGEVGARVHGLPVEQHHAGAALRSSQPSFAPVSPTPSRTARRVVAGSSSSGRRHRSPSRVSGTFTAHLRRRGAELAPVETASPRARATAALPDATRDHLRHRTAVVGRRAERLRSARRRPRRPRGRPDRIDAGVGARSASSASGTSLIVGASAVIATPRRPNGPTGDCDRRCRARP